jgi:hypothetical protein
MHAFGFWFGMTSSTVWEFIGFPEKTIDTVLMWHGDTIVVMRTRMLRFDMQDALIGVQSEIFCLKYEQTTTNHLRLLPEGVTETSQIFFRDIYVLENDFDVRNTADVTSGKPIAVWSQSVSCVTAVYPLVAFYDVHGRKGEASHETKVEVYLRKDWLCETRCERDGSKWRMIEESGRRRECKPDRFRTSYFRSFSSMMTSLAQWTEYNPIA